MKLNHEDYKSALSGLRVSEKVNQNLLKENKDTDFEQWLMRRQKKEDRKKRNFRIAVLAAIFLIALCGLFRTAEYRRIFNRLEQEGTCVTAEYHKAYRGYVYYETGKQGKAGCAKSIFFEQQGDTAKLYYIGDDFTQAVPLVCGWVWITAYFICGVMMFGSAACIYRLILHSVRRQ